MMLTLVDIPRVKAGTSISSGKPLAEIDQERLYLATRAKDLLGYSTLTESVTGQRRVGIAEGQLTACLLKLDIPVLDTMTVITYQVEEMGRRDLAYITAHIKEWAGNEWGVSPARWENTNLNAYTLPVPEFVLDKAIKIKEALPEVQFNIQYLSDPKADPFLVAYLDKELYYIDAWDEPRFERGM